MKYYRNIEYVGYLEYDEDRKWGLCYTYYNGHLSSRPLEDLTPDEIDEDIWHILKEDEYAKFILLKGD